MPQVDLESLVCGAAGAGAGDRKVSCETVIAGDASPPPPPPPLPDPDFPPESITIRIGSSDEAAFSELNPIYERDDSTKGSTNPKSAAAGGGASNPVPLKSRSNSTRIAGARAPAAAGATTTFFGLPAKIRRPSFTRRQPSQGRILPDKRSGGEEEEPRSPKVSCIGKVLSDRERCGRRRRRRWWRGVVAVFRCGGGGCACRGIGGPGRKMASDDDDYGEEDEEPSIAGMRKFKSGRRAATWGQEALAAAAAAAAASPGEAQEGEEKHESHETEHWARLPVS